MSEIENKPFLTEEMIAILRKDYEKSWYDAVAQHNYKQLGIGLELIHRLLCRLEEGVRRRWGITFTVYGRIAG